jgi:hypothetical protein
VDAEADVDAANEDEQVEDVEPLQEPVKVGKKMNQKEQKALEAAEKKARDAAEKKEKKELEAAEKKAKKEQEAAEKKAKKEQEAAEKVTKATSKLVKASKPAEKKVEEVKEEPVEEPVEKPVEEPVEEVKEAPKELVTPIKAKPVKITKEAPIKAKKVVKKDKEPEWTCEDDGNAHPWTFEGKHYMRGFDGSVWHATADGEIGDWAGKYDAKMGNIDESAPEEVYMDE